MESTIYAAKSYVQADNISVKDSKAFLLDHVNRLCNRIKNIVRHGSFPVVIGGDHACAMGTWSGVISEFEAEENFGLIWVDAHMDAHTIETSPSKAYHGMPLAHLLGAGEEEFYEIGSPKRKINPKHLCLIGIRSFEKEEQKLLETLGVRIFYMHEIRKRGFDAVWKEAVEIVNKGTKGFGVSIDLDAFDPSEAPATGSLEKGGLLAGEIMPAFQKISKMNNFRALEIAEFNPTLPGKIKTLDLMESILQNILPKDGGK